MKPLTYWEAKYEAATRRLQTLRNLYINDYVPKAPRRKDMRNLWPNAMKRWKSAQQRSLHRKHRIKKLEARLRYFEGRITLLTPTFWDKLREKD